MEPPPRQRARSQGDILGDLSRTTRRGMPTSVQVRLQASIAGLEELHLLRESQQTLIEQAKSLMCRNKDMDTEISKVSKPSSSSKVTVGCTDGGVKSLPRGQEQSYWHPPLLGGRPRALSLSVLPSKYTPPARKSYFMSVDSSHEGDAIVQMASDQQMCTQDCSSRLPMTHTCLSLDIGKRQNIVLSQNLEAIDRELTDSGQPPGMIKSVSDSKVIQSESMISKANVWEKGGSPCERWGSFTFGVDDCTTVRSERRSSLSGEISLLQADYRQPCRLSGSGPSYNFPSPMHAVLLQYGSTCSIHRDVSQPASYSGSHLEQAMTNSCMESHALGDLHNPCNVRAASDGDSCTSSDTITSEAITMLEARPSTCGIKQTNYRTNTNLCVATETQCNKQENKIDNDGKSRGTYGFRDLLLENEHNLNTDGFQNQSQISSNTDAHAAARLSGEGKVQQKRKRLTCLSVTSSEEGYFSSQPSTPRSRRHKLSIQSDISFASTGSSFILPEFNDEEKGVIDTGRAWHNPLQEELTKEEANNNHIYRCEEQLVDIPDTSV